jgi:type IV pilus assembly protein PilC
MPSYKYQARLSTGRIDTGELTADSATAAAALLRRQGQHVLRLVRMPTRSPVNWKKIWEVLNTGTGPSQKDILDFTTQLAVMIRAGINVRLALEGIADQSSNPRFKRILQQLRNDIEGGKSFSEALARHPRQFNALYVNMVKASEMTGSFSKMLDRIAGFMQQQIETRKMVIGASIYPGVIATMAIGVTIFLLTFVLPRFAGVFEGKEEVLPGPTKFLMGLSDWMVHQWWIPVVGICVGLVGFFTFIRTEIGRSCWDKFRLKVPLFGPMFRALYVSRSLQTMGELLNAGVPVLDSLTVTGDIAGNLHYRRLWRRVGRAVRDGRRINSELEHTNLLPRSVVQMVAAGEESGRLGEVLEEIASFYVRVLKDSIKTMTSMIEPLLIVAMGSLVGFIAMAIILPIFKMSSLVSG